MAFPHVFKHCTAMPDPPEWSPNPRHRRAPDAPRIELGKWVQVMARRCEAQIGRDWTFGFTSWNLLFRSALNLSRTPVKYTGPVFDETSKAWRNLTAKDIEAGAVQLLAALQQGSYVDLHGRPKQVKGDMSKLPYVRGLQPAARRLLQNMRAVGSTLPGTQEARRTMRFEIEALRIRFGVPLFVTFSPTRHTNFFTYECHGLATRIQCDEHMHSRSGSQATKTSPILSTPTLWQFILKPSTSLGTAPRNTGAGSSRICRRFQAAGATCLDSFIRFAHVRTMSRL